MYGKTYGKSCVGSRITAFSTVTTSTTLTSIIMFINVTTFTNVNTMMTDQSDNLFVAYSFLSQDHYHQDLTDPI